MLYPLPAGEGQGETSPNPSSRFEPLNRSRRRKEAERVANQMNPPRYLGGYNTEVHGEGEWPKMNLRWTSCERTSRE